MTRPLKTLAVRLLKATHENSIYYIKDFLHLRELRRRQPELDWSISRACPRKRVDAAGCQIGHQLFVIGGFNYTLDFVHDLVDVFDLARRRWLPSIPTPAGFPQTHNGWASDGARFIYCVAGQLGPRCSPAVSRCDVLDTATRSWLPFPELPEARYAPAVVLWRGRLHAMGGARPDRATSALDHWSIGVEDGRPTDDGWRRERPIPRGGPHHLSAVLEDSIYLLGGQEGDLQPVPGDPDYACDYSTGDEVFFDDTYALREPGGEWERAAGMPVAATHAGLSTAFGDSRALIVGGVTDRYAVTDAIQLYDAATDTWTVLGRLPYGYKTPAVGYWDGWLFAATGQRSIGIDDMRHGEVLPSVWRARLNLE